MIFPVTLRLRTNRRRSCGCGCGGGRWRSCSRCCCCSCSSRRGRRRKGSCCCRCWSWRWCWCCAKYELRLAGDAVRENSNQRVADGESARTRSHQSDRRGSERSVRPSCHRIHRQQKRLLVGKAKQLDQRIVRRRVLRAVAAGSFGDALET